MGSNVTARGRIALVTGAGSGIGRAASLALQAVGYSVVLAGRRGGKLEETAAMADPSGGEMLAVPTDVSQPESVKEFFARTTERFGRLDLLFNNAGTNAPAVPLEELTFEHVENPAQRGDNKHQPLVASYSSVPRTLLNDLGPQLGVHSRRSFSPCC